MKKWDLASNVRRRRSSSIDKITYGENNCFAKKIGGVRMQTIIRRMGSSFSALIQRIMPDAYIFCLLLTLVAMAGAIAITGHSPASVINMWGDGFWRMLTFSMQSSLALVAGYILSSAPIFKKGLGKVASLPNTFGQAIVLAVISSFALWYFHWGVGAVATGIICLEITRQLIKKGIKIHYPLLVAASYMGTVVWHNGISGASQLLVASQNHFLFEQIGIVPVSQTIFASGNIMIVLALLIIVPTLAYFMIPEEKDFVSPPKDRMESDETKDTALNTGEKGSIGHFLNNSPIVSITISLIGLFFIYYWFTVWNRGFDLNSFIVIMMTASIIGHWRLSGYIANLKNAVKTAIPIMLQFQFYGGILGILSASGLVIVLANFFVTISTELTFPAFVYLGAGIVNLFVPSGGGQWIVQGAIVIDAAQQINANIPRTITAFACGDAWTNLLQPFWVLPLLAFAGLKVRDIMGYCAVILIFTFVIVAALLMFAPFPTI